MFSEKKEKKKMRCNQNTSFTLKLLGFNKLASETSYVMNR